MKTSKDKAEELYDQINTLIPIDAQFSDTGKQASDKMIQDHKSTLLICNKLVDEIINEWNNVEGIEDGPDWVNLYVLEAKVKFWQEVKNELNKML